MLNLMTYRVPQKKVTFKPIFEFLTLGGVFLEVRNNSKNFGKKIKHKTNFYRVELYSVKVKDR